MHLDHDRCCAVVRSKDPRYDGWFVTGVLSTKIYCRPSCPAITPRVRNMRFYPSAAAAQAAGLRACRRCLPDATPGSPDWHVRGDVVARAIRLLSDGVVDREGVGGLARRLGYSMRQLERLLRAELGAGPLALARAQRAQTARLLVEGSTLTMAEVALAAGFSSIRSFNDTVRSVYAATPTELRRTARRRGPSAGRGRDGERAAGPGHAPGLGDGAPVTIALRLPQRAPLHAPSLFGHLAATAVPGVESWGDGALSRTLRLPGGPGVVALRPPGESGRHVPATVRLSAVADLSTAIGRCRRLLDLDADPQAVDEHLGNDPVLAPLVRSTPGVRLPGAVDGAEMALRAVLGQQVSTAAAATQAGRLVRALGTPLPEGFGASGWGEKGVTHVFPEPQLVAEAPDGLLPGMPATRRRTLRALAAALADGTVDLGPGSDRRAAEEQLLTLPGIGPWTAHIVLLRGLGDPDAFPASDLGVRTAAAAAGLPADPRALGQFADRWRPWRSYATALLWASSSHAAARLPLTHPTRPHQEKR
ncbi:DNA-3-methyladenine glycosylase 2 family protein [Ornithinimicrobium pratense]|uniref:DNA-3-methyladenine glycosylase II n=1 Tax=Ornithinimicrobium pratense TaxID=2593973 RepID=A0A5J6VA00_9MICO|nr:DNA-3-methyladenine glycosylase 2 family protein [Ornithinimicrobium pratense]